MRSLRGRVVRALDIEERIQAQPVVAGGQRCPLGVAGRTEIDDAVVQGNGVARVQRGESEPFEPAQNPRDGPAGVPPPYT